MKEALEFSSRGGKGCRRLSSQGNVSHSFSLVSRGVSGLGEHVGVSVWTRAEPQKWREN